jgi:hypothetical protein
MGKDNRSTAYARSTQHGANYTHFGTPARAAKSRIQLAARPSKAVKLGRLDSKAIVDFSDHADSTMIMVLPPAPSHFVIGER